MEKLQKRATKNIQGLEKMLYSGRLELFLIKKMRYLIPVSKYLQGEKYQVLSYFAFLY